MSSPLRRTGLSAAALVLALALAACGGDDDSGDSGGKADSGPAVLTQEEADGAALTAEDVGEGFTAEKDDDADDDADADLGCLTGITKLGDVKAATETEFNIDAESETAARSVLSVVNSYEDTATIEDAFADFREVIEGCDSIDVTDEEGVTIVLDVTLVDGEPIGEVDDQLSFTSTGSITNGEQSFPYELAFTASRIENNLSVVGVMDVGEKGEDLMVTLTETAVQRLNDAIA
jgi:hypothetical protein